MKFGSLFSGIGGLDLGLERAGMTCAWQVEIDEWCRRVLARHWPDVPRWDDVTTFPPAHADRTELRLEPGRGGTAAAEPGDDGSPWAVDLICGGFPCQPVSVAGKRRGQDDERWLWPEFARIVRLLRPRFVLVENVPGLLARGMGDVLGDLAACGYDAEWDCIPAAAVGAPHLRYRVFIVGRQVHPSRSDADGLRSHRAEVNEHGWSEQGRAQLRDEHERESRSVGGDVAYTEIKPQRARLRPSPEGWIWWATEPNVGRVAHGVPSRVDRLRGLGNAVVPQVAEWIGRRLMEVA